MFKVATISLFVLSSTFVHAQRDVNKKSAKVQVEDTLQDYDLKCEAPLIVLE